MAEKIEQIKSKEAEDITKVQTFFKETVRKAIVQDNLVQRNKIAQI